MSLEKSNISQTNSNEVQVNLQRPQTSQTGRIYKPKLYKSRNKVISNKQQIKQLFRKKHYSKSKIQKQKNSKSVQKNLKQQCQLEKIKITIHQFVQGGSQMSKNILIQRLTIFDPFFKKIQYNIAESIFYLSKVVIYNKNQLINVGALEKIGFILYGRLKLSNQDFQFVINRGETYGQHLIQNKVMICKVKCLQQSCLLWIPFQNYKLLRQQSIKNGFKNEFQYFETQLRLSSIKKKLTLKQFI